ncbi:MAG TPA: hypothetical protein VGF55_30960 [Gemmataceae bacterium]
MSRPALNSPTEFPHKLHKREGHADSATIFGSHIAVGDDVTVNGTRGHVPTTWTGSIATDNGDGSFDVTNLTVDHEEAAQKPKHKHNDTDDAGGGGAEDVSVTVTNVDGPSAPVVTRNVPTVP